MEGGGWSEGGGGGDGELVRRERGRVEGRME